jgi:transcription initiation factor TFIIE subunit alpha
MISSEYLVMPANTITNLSIVKDFLETVGGPDALKLTKLCENKRKQVTDEELAKKMQMKVTEVRTILNRLHYRGITCYEKTRNQKTGWFNYTWELRKDKIANLIIEQQKEKMNKLTQKRDLEADHSLFDCISCDERSPFEIAVENNFVCPSCGSPMNSANDPKKTKELEKRIQLIEKELEILNKIKK